MFLSSEVAPFAKTGGLADVASALPRALFDMGHDVRIMMPKYGPISERKFVLREVIRLKKIPVKMGPTEHITCAKSAFIPDSKVQVYFLDYRPFFDRPDLYVNPKNGKDYEDNAERFMLFCKAVIETIKLLHWEPQVIHCNDWQTALIPWLLKNEYGEDPFFNRTASLLSIHNLAYQGLFDLDKLGTLGLPDELRQAGSEMEFYGKLNFLKSGIHNADAITTVSQNYALEIQKNPEMGAGLEGVLLQRKKDIFGILNGVDYTVWDPETDKFIKAQYSAANLKDKLKNKIALLEKCEMPFDESTPLVGMISRLDSQKGFDLFEQSIKDLIKMNIQIVILGTGDKKVMKFLERIGAKYPEKFAVLLRFDEKMAHLIEAGSDIFLMPSRYEPCGLNQMFSLKYGTIPVVRKTGGLADTIVDYIEDPSKGNGFVFERYDRQDMLAALRNAVDLFSDTSTWQKLMKRGMRLNFSWQAAAEKYVKIYNKLDSIKRKK